MMKRVFLLIAVVLTASAVFAGGPPSGGNGAQAAEDKTPQQMQSSAEDKAVTETVSGPTSSSIIPLPEKLQQRFEKIGQKMDKYQQRRGTKDVSQTTEIPSQIRMWLILGIILILAGAIISFIPGFIWLGSTLGTAGFICLVVALVIYLMNYA